MYIRSMSKKKDVGAYDRILKRLERLQQKTYKQPLYRYPGQCYYYVFGYTKAGKTVCLGPYMVEAEASNVLATLGDGEIFDLNTRDLNKATREIKHILMSRSGDPDEALKKMLHQKGLQREEERESKK